MVQNCSIWHQWSRGDRALVHGRDNAAPGDRPDAEVRQGTAWRALRGRWRRSQRRGDRRGEQTGWAAYFFFSFASPKLSAAELMQ